MQAQTDLKKSLPLRLRLRLRPAARRAGVRSKSRSRRTGGKPVMEESNQAAAALVASVLQNLVDEPERIASHRPKTKVSKRTIDRRRMRREQAPQQRRSTVRRSKPIHQPSSKVSRRQI
eukprot:jgi/Bigna1/147571/aug1.210_g22279